MAKVWEFCYMLLANCTSSFEISLLLVHLMFGLHRFLVVSIMSCLFMLDLDINILLLMWLAIFLIL